MRAPTPRDLIIASRSRSVNIISYCDTNIRNYEISAIVGPRLAALVSVTSREFEEGAKTAMINVTLLADY